MKYQLRFQEEPFEAYSELDELAETFDTEFTDTEWEEERGGRFRQPQRSIGSRSRLGRPVVRPKRPFRPPGRRPRIPRPRPLRPVWGPAVIVQNPPNPPSTTPEPPRPPASDPTGAAGGGPPPPSDTSSAPEGSEYIRWVQSSLNRILSLRLPVDGITGTETRSAIRSFQERQGIPADGIVGPDTERALRAARSGQPAGTEATKSDASGMTKPSESAATPPGPDSAEPAAEFEFAWENFGEEFEDGKGEVQWEETAKKSSSFRYVKALSGSDVDCVAAMKTAKKTRSQALAVINTQIGQAIRMLREAANKLQRGKRSAQTRAIFQKTFRVKPEFVPTWLRQTATIKDRGDVVATRCRQVANLLERGGLRYFCTISEKNCPDCADGHDYSTTYACSSWGDESAAPQNSRVICLNAPFWKAMGAKPIDTPTILAVLMHEPFHVYYGQYVTRHDRTNPGKFGAIYCTTQFVFEVNGKTDYPAWMKKVCIDTHARG